MLSKPGCFTTELIPAGSPSVVGGLLCRYSDLDSETVTSDPQPAWDDEK